MGDGKSVLELSDDAVRANWGGSWQMPTHEDFQELLANTTNEWVTVGTVTGRKFTSKVKNADDTYNSIFLPAAGYRRDGSLELQGFLGGYWSATVLPSRSYYARLQYFNSSSVGTFNDGNYRCRGVSVRAVLKN